MDQRTKLALDLYDCGAFMDETHPTAFQRGNERGFKLILHKEKPDAPLSPFYMMLRTPENPGKPGPLTPDLVERCAAQMIGLVEDRGLFPGRSYDCICGLPNAGEPFVAAMHDLYSKKGSAPNLVQLRKEEDERGRRVVGPPIGTYSRGQKVIVFDDLITEAHTKLEGIRALEDVGLTVILVVVLVDRQQGGSQQLEAAGYHLDAVFTISNMLDIYVEHGRTSSELRHKIRQYAELP